MYDGMAHLYTRLEKLAHVQKVGHSWLSLFFTQRTQTATKGLLTFELDITVSYVGHTFQTCHVMTSNKCVQLQKK